MKKNNRKNRGVRANCGGKGCYISLYVLPYGSVSRRRNRVNRSVKAKV